MKEVSFTQKLHIDGPLLFGIIVLSLIGYVVLYSASDQNPDLIIRRSIHLAAALSVMFIVAQVPPARLSGISLWFYLVSLGLLILVLFFGETGKGAQRWLGVGPFRFQPSELMKLALPMVIALYLSKELPPPSIGKVFMVLIFIIAPVLLVAKQPDLGTAMLIAVSGFAVLFIAGISWKLLAGFAVVAMSSAPVIWNLMHDYQQKRVLTFLNPEQDPLGSGYHIIQSKIAIGSGGLYGKGWLNGTQSHLEFLPERSTDFIFAVFCEEFGLLGVLILISIYLFIIARGLYISMEAQHVYGKLLSVGVVAGFFVYIAVNMGMVSGQLPVVGIPLPLISHGGTSMLTIMAGFGILMAVHTHRRLLSN
ncbi:MAG: rod shape-determining protein RodA [Gammaproteobacteria bacterium]|nr:rod shape-determining protein RodA [Gammaproteobacteria bacterium]